MAKATPTPAPAANALQSKGTRGPILLAFGMLLEGFGPQLGLTEAQLGSVMPLLDAVVGVLIAWGGIDLARHRIGQGTNPDSPERPVNVLPKALRKT